MPLVWMREGQALNAGILRRTWTGRTWMQDKARAQKGGRRLATAEMAFALLLIAGMSLFAWVIL